MRTQTSAVTAYLPRDDVLERDSELVTVDLLLQRVCEGAGHLLVFEGSAGIGKTQLLKAVCQRAQRSDVRVIAARAAEPESNFPFSVVRQLFEPVLAAESKGERRLLLSYHATCVAHAILEQPRPSSDGELRENEHAILHGIFSLTLNLAKRKPLLIAVDDAQWMDAPSLHCLGYLVRRLSQVGTLVVLTSTPVASDVEHSGLEEILCDPAAHTLRLQPVSEAAVSRLIREAVSAEPDASFGSACHAASGGNPLFLREMLAELAAGRIQPIAAETEQASALGSRSLARFESARFSKLPSAAKALAEAVAVLGDGVGYRRAAELAQLDYTEAGHAARVLIDAGIFEPSSSLSFAQGLVRAAVHARLDPARRDALHDRAARVLDRAGASADQVAKLLLAAEPKADEWAVELLRRAAYDAANSGALDQAATYLRRALTEPPTQGRTFDLLSALGTAEVHRGASAGFDRLRAAMDQADHPLRSEVGLELGRLLALVGDPAEAIRVLGSLEADIEGSRWPLAERFELSFAAAERNDLASLPAGTRRLARAAANGNAAPSKDLLASMALTSAARAGPRSESVGLARRAIELMRDGADRDPMTVCVAASALTWTDKLDLAGPVCELFAADARQRGSRLLVAVASGFQSHVAYRRGFIGDARCAATASLEAACPEAWGSSSLLYPIAFFVDALIEQDELEAAHRKLMDAGFAAGLPELWPCNFVLDSRGRLKLAQRNHEEALNDFLECGRRLAAWGVTNPGVIPWRAHATRALVAADRADEGYELAAEELDLARRVGGARAIGIALHAAGWARGQAGIHLLREAVDLFTESDASFDLAYALTDLGTVLSRRGQRLEARKPLRVAVDLAARCGATALRDRAHDELLTAGARPRRLSLNGPGSLTAREQRMATLAADGLTNKRIAESVFLSEKTVELHLRNAYEKLGIAGRSGLTGALEPKGSLTGQRAELSHSTASEESPQLRPERHVAVKPESPAPRPPESVGI